MWITEITLKNQARRISLDSGLAHRWLTRAADGPEFLWSSPRPGLVIVATTRPLDRDALRDAASNIFAAERNLTFAQGTTVEVGGIVNPTRAQAVRGQRGIVKPLPPEEVPSWVERKLSPALTIKTLEYERLPTSRGVKTDGTRVTHARTSIHLTGTVRDSDALAEILTHGVGRGKRYGAGLLLAREIS